MKLRSSALGLIAVAVSLFGFAGSASAITRVPDPQCKASNDFATFYHGGEKTCFSNANPSQTWVGLDHVNGFSSGVYSGWVTYRDGADGQIKTYAFGKRETTGCNDCTIKHLHLDQ